MKKSKENKPTIILLTGFGVNHRFLMPCKIFCKLNGWNCEIVKNSLFASNDLDTYSDSLREALTKHNNAIVVGTSLGGVATVYAMAKDSVLNDKIVKAFTVCSPINGSADWIFDSKIITKALNLNVPDKYIPNILLMLKKLALSFKERTAAMVIKDNLSYVQKSKINALFHENDLISPPGRSFLEGMKVSKIPYNYNILPKLLHHHLACADPRVYLGIFREIKSLY